jgi:SAM-dependent methyltransferase
MTDHALSFGGAARSYDRYRPSYPAAAVGWALGSPPGRVRVADLGSGTGLLARVLLGLGHDVVPVEPDAAMRAQLAASTPGLAPLAGTAESVPLPDGAVDAALAGQAYHWFDPDRAPAEIARVLRPGGVFAAIWNLRDESVPWVARLTEVAYLEEPGERMGRRIHDEQLRAAGFGPVSHAVFSHAVTHTPDSLVELMKTRSHYLAAPPGGRAVIEDGLRDLTATHPDLRGRDSFDLPYRTAVFRCHLPR